MWKFPRIWAALKLKPLSTGRIAFESLVLWNRLNIIIATAVLQIQNNKKTNLGSIVHRQPGYRTSLFLSVISRGNWQSCPFSRDRDPKSTTSCCAVSHWPPRSSSWEANKVDEHLYMVTSGSAVKFILKFKIRFVVSPKDIAPDQIDFRDPTPNFIVIFPLCKLSPFFLLSTSLDSRSLAIRYRSVTFTFGCLFGIGSSALICVCVRLPTQPQCRLTHVLVHCIACTLTKRNH